MSTFYAAAGGSYSDYRIYAIFATREAAQAFLDDPMSDADTIEEREVYETLPPKVTWYEIVRYRRGPSDPFGPTHRRSTIQWAFDGPPFVGYRRAAWNFHRWPNGERAFGQDKAAVAKAWKEAHALEEATAAGL